MHTPDLSPEPSVHTPELSPEPSVHTPDLSPPSVHTPVVSPAQSSSLVSKKVSPSVTIKPCSVVLDNIDSVVSMLNTKRSNELKNKPKKSPKKSKHVPKMKTKSKKSNESEKKNACIAGNQCPVCQKSFMHNYKLHKHIIKRHKNFMYQCTYCNKTFHTNNGLYKHNRTHQLGCHKCTKCGKTFQYPLCLANHMRLHSKKKLLKCKYKKAVIKSMPVLMPDNFIMKNILLTRYSVVLVILKWTLEPT